MKPKKTALAALVAACTIVASALPARAESKAPPPWALASTWKLGLQWLGGVRSKMGRSPRSLMLDVPFDAPWLGADLGLTLLARNRGSTSFLLGDDERSAVDFANVIRSSRMLLERVTLTGGRLQPFMQVGLGEWSRDLDKRTWADLWYGAQGGGGLQLRLFGACSLAVEADDTMIRNRMQLKRRHVTNVRSGFFGLQIVLP